MARKRIDSNIEIVVQNNLHSMFVYPKLGIEFSQNGDDDIVTYGELKSLNSGNGKRILRNFSLLVTEVLDDDVSYEDVIESLKLKDNYNEARKVLDLDEDENFDADDFYDFIVESETSELVDAAKNDKFSKVITEGAMVAHKEKEIPEDKLRQVLIAIGFEDVADLGYDLQGI